MVFKLSACKLDSSSQKCIPLQITGFPFKETSGAVEKCWLFVQATKNPYQKAFLYKSSVRVAHLCDTGGKTLATVERAARARASEPARRPLGVPMELLYLMSRLTIIFSLVVELFWWYSVTYQMLADGISSSYYKWKLSWYHLP